MRACVCACVCACSMCAQRRYAESIGYVNSISGTTVAKQHLRTAVADREPLRPVKEGEILAFAPDPEYFARRRNCMGSCCAVWLGRALEDETIELGDCVYLCFCASIFRLPVRFHDWSCDYADEFGARLHPAQPDDSFSIAWMGVHQGKNRTITNSVTGSYALRCATCAKRSLPHEWDEEVFVR